MCPAHKLFVFFLSLWFWGRPAGHPTLFFVLSTSPPTRLALCVMPPFQSLSPVCVSASFPNFKGSPLLSRDRQAVALKHDHSQARCRSPPEHPAWSTQRNRQMLPFACFTTLVTALSSSQARLRFPSLLLLPSGSRRCLPASVCPGVFLLSFSPLEFTEE